MRTVIVFLIAFSGACAPHGGEGQPGSSGGTLSGFSCNAGLVCVNFGSLCVAMHSQQAGSPCYSLNEICAVGLACVGPDGRCGTPLGRGEVCALTVTARPAWIA